MTTMNKYHLTLTRGKLPTQEQFDEAWAHTVEEESNDPYCHGGVQTGTFGFGNDKRLGNCRLNQTELWCEILKAFAEMQAFNDEGKVDEADAIDSWIESVFAQIMIEWI